MANTGNTAKRTAVSWQPIQAVSQARSATEPAKETRDMSTEAEAPLAGKPPPHLAALPQIFRRCDPSRLPLQGLETLQDKAIG